MDEAAMKREGRVAKVGMDGEGGVEGFVGTIGES